MPGNPALRRASTGGVDAAHRLVLPALRIAVPIARIDTAIADRSTEPIGTAFGVRVGALPSVVDAHHLAYAVLLLTGERGRCTAWSDQRAYPASRLAMPFIHASNADTAASSARSAFVTSM
ncbi:hypothetical protein [Burkholderia sp. BCC1972]|uniref:hypothetical protein n=1 Tax=Burkholderia sp. BCC1972 TaxID=2817438 RepID=UPI002ABD2BAF|nr:hypothetical protein [Burkholderia sp. BCC1972]